MSILCPQASAANPDDKAIKDVIAKYYNTRYEALSVLEEKDISSFWKTDTNPEYELEVNTLSADANHRKMQLIDLRFKSYNLQMEFEKINVKNDKSDVKVKEMIDFYQNASPNTCSRMRDDHIIKLEKINNNWLITSDSSNNPSKKILSALIEKGNTASQAKAKILELSKEELLEKKAIASTPNKASRSVATTLSLQPYNASYAAAWAYQYALQNNPSPWHTYSSDEGGDCTNFVSICLYKGDIPFDTVGDPRYNQRWFWNNTSNYTPTWTGVIPLWDYAINDGGVGLSASSVDRQNAYTGDIVQFNNGSWHHSAFINNAYTYNDYRFIFICCHSANQQDVNLDNYLASETRRYLHINGWYN